MGAKFGNIQVLNTSVEEIRTLLPKAVVGQWSERFVTALSEEYQLGTVEREGQKLSRRVAGPVLTVSLFDDDLLSLTVYQGGKRLTEHVLNPYDGINKAGNPAVFCATLGLPDEDEKRLRAVWKKGNATEQLDLTQMLLAAPLWCDESWQPDASVARDAEAVDRWLKERPAPPKVKNQTKVELIQELEPYRPYWSLGVMASTAPYFALQLLDEDGVSHIQNACFYLAGPDGRLHDANICRPDWDDLLQTGKGGFLCYCGTGTQRILVLEQENVILDYGRAEMRIVWDSSGQLSVPLALKLEGRNRQPVEIRSLPDGGLLVELCDDGFDMPAVLVRYGSDGEILETRTKEPSSHMMSNAPDGGFWLPQPTGMGTMSLSRLDADRKELSHSTDIPGVGLCIELSPDEFTLLVTSPGEGIWLLDAATLAVKQELRTKAEIYAFSIDGHGRFWVQNGNSTVESYNEDLQPVSHHRLKGSIYGSWEDADGNLCVLTKEEARRVMHWEGQPWKSELYQVVVGAKRDVIRVYRIS